MNKEFCDSCEEEIISDELDFNDKRVELNTIQERLVFCDKDCLMDYLNNEVVNDEE